MAAHSKRIVKGPSADADGVSLGFPRCVPRCVLRNGLSVRNYSLKAIEPLPAVTVEHGRGEGIGGFHWAWNGVETLIGDLAEVGIILRNGLWAGLVLKARRAAVRLCWLA